MIAVTFALPAESSEFVRLIAQGRLHGHEVRVLHTGVGQRITETRLAAFFAEHAPRLLVSSGFAGALTDELKPGDIFAAENFSAPALLSSIKQGQARSGRLETIDAVMDSLGERAAFAQRTGAMAVDMETRFIADACADARVPLLSLRAISDSPSAPFGIPARILFDVEKQRTPYGKLALHLMKHPGAIGKLTALAKQVGTARSALTAALDNFLRGLDVH
jgi:adenosylhomocysteine nucleosidase